MNQKLKNKIESKLNKLSKLLDNITEAQIIVPHEPETWDVDTLHNLNAQLKEALQLLQDQKLNRRNEFGETNILVEERLCSLMDTYQENKEEDYE